jgi:hypothetical protein
MSGIYNIDNYMKEGRPNLDSFPSRNFNTNTSHPLIQNSQEYMYYKKYVSIHSEDRDILKYPNPSEFEIEIPEDLLNVASLRLVSWTFPANYNTFSINTSNISMTFKINNPYNPNINNVSNLLVQKTFECLFYNQNDEYLISIEEGFYNPSQMVTELTNKFNHAVTNKLKSYFVEKALDSSLTVDERAEYVKAKVLLTLAGGYTNFVIVYNNVSQKIWFGNRCDGFTLTNESQLIKNTLVDNLYCGYKSQLPDFSNWGLPGNLGLTRCNVESVSGSKLTDSTQFSTYEDNIVPRFYYGDVAYGDEGYWLLPDLDLTGSEVHWIECTYKINLMGPGYMYMEIEGQNCIDETSPYNVNQFTLRTNETNGVVNSAFAKIAIPTTPISQWFDRDSLPYKFYYPPAERMRRFKIKMRYHNGEVANFGVFNYSFVIEFTLQMPQILRNSTIVSYPQLSR